MKHPILLILLLLLPFHIFSQEEENLVTETEVTTEKMTIDEKVNEKFMPIAVNWESFILSSFITSKNEANQSNFTFGLLSKKDKLSEKGHTNIMVYPLVLILLVGGALFFTIYFGLIQILKFPLSINVVRGKYDEIEKIGIGDKEFDAEEMPEQLQVNVAEDGDIVDTIKDESQDGEVSHFQALATAVSGTVGLGNIAGVAVAIALGGPGATFWMIVCGLLGMATKFVECTLAVSYRDVESDGTVFGGPMYYMSRGLKNTKFSGLGKVLAGIFAVMCVGASFGGGNAFQSNQAAQQISTMFNLEGGATGLVIGVILAALVAIVIIGGIKSIAKVTEKIVPFMAGLYVLACLVIIFANFGLIGRAFQEIIAGAFTPQAGLGGFIGVLIVGFQRAAFSNEAGAGSAAIAHSAVKTKFAASEGIVALLEPFIDTVVICTMTALVIILFNMNHGDPGTMFNYGNLDANNNVILNNELNGQSVLGGVDLTSAAFGSVLPFFPTILTVAIVLFAFSTMISWSYYGLQAWKYLFGRGKTADIAYKILFLFFVVIGAAATLDAVIKFSDAMILALVFPNMIGLLLLYPRVRKRLNLYLASIKKDKLENE